MLYKKWGGFKLNPPHFLLNAYCNYSFSMIPSTIPYLMASCASIQ